MICKRMSFWVDQENITDAKEKDSRVLSESSGQARQVKLRQPHKNLSLAGRMPIEKVGVGGLAGGMQGFDT